MMLVLSHLFGRLGCKQADTEEQAEVIRRSPSMVYLPPMPEDAADILRNHNQETLEIFASYVKTFATQNVKEEENRLPFTRTPVGSAEGIDAKPVNNHASANGHAEVDENKSSNKNSATANFLPSLPRPHARSAFVALSGLGDNFTTIKDLCSSTREGIFLESAVIPHLEFYPDEARHPLNAYLLDFYIHGSLEPLETANGIGKSEVSDLFSHPPLTNISNICHRFGLSLMISLLFSPLLLTVSPSISVWALTETPKCWK